MLIKKKINSFLENYNNVVIWGAGGLAAPSIKFWIPRDKVSYVVDDFIPIVNKLLILKVQKITPVKK